jgi:hypothetical protein
MTEPSAALREMRRVARNRRRRAADGIRICFPISIVAWVV